MPVPTKLEEGATVVIPPTNEVDGSTVPMNEEEGAAVPMELEGEGARMMVGAYCRSVG